MAEEQKDQSQKTELPTQKRLQEARKKGEVARYQEVRHAAMFGGAAISAALLVGFTAAAMGPLVERLWGAAHDIDLSPTGAEVLTRAVLIETGLALAPIMGALMGAAILGGALSGRPTLSWNRVKPKWSKLSPLAGLKRQFGPQGLAEFVKTIAKFVIVAAAGVFAVWPEAGRLEGVVGGGAEEMSGLVGALAIRMLLIITSLVIAMAILDILWQRHRFQRRMMMTRQELKDEQKDTEGSPETRARLRNIRLDRASQRMIAAVPDAAVVIMNPTHFAVALSYEHGEDAVPACCAKGTDEVALRIRAVAEEHEVPVVENPPLARTLHAAVDIGDPVPTEHYKAVAEIISYVLRLGERRRS